jgi:hypothetical protein
MINATMMTNHHHDDTSMNANTMNAQPTTPAARQRRQHDECQHHDTARAPA